MHPACLVRIADQLGLRACLVNHRTRRDDIDAVVERIATAV
jgi:hypothetical protein